MDTNYLLCQPDGSTTGQGVAIVVRFLETHPERRQESFSALVFEALVRA
jgi:hypothetical protein